MKTEFGEYRWKPTEDDIQSLKEIAHDIFHSGINSGEIGCKLKLKNSGMVILNPDIDWEKELTKPCKDCKDFSPSNTRLVYCTKHLFCEKCKRYNLAKEIYKVFKNDRQEQDNSPKQREI